jgi:hypothetical protein
MGRGGYFRIETLTESLENRGVAGFYFLLWGEPGVLEVLVWFFAVLEAVLSSEMAAWCRRSSSTRPATNASSARATFFCVERGVGMVQQALAGKLVDHRQQADQAAFGQARRASVSVKTICSATRRAIVR